MLKKGPRIPLINFEELGVIIGVNDQVYISYVGKDHGPYHLRSFATADKTRLFLQVDATAQVPIPEINMPIRVTWPITESHDGYTFGSRIIGVTEPDQQTGFLSLVIQVPRPSDVRKMDNRRDTIRLPARWEGAIKWQSEIGGRYEMEGVIHNVSSTGCSIHISIQDIEQMETIDAMSSYVVSDRYLVSMRPPLDLINASERDDPEVIYAPFADIESLTRGRMNHLHDGKRVQVISFQFPHERPKLNQLITKMQLPRK